MAGLTLLGHVTHWTCVEFLRVLGSQSGVSAWQHILVG